MPPLTPQFMQPFMTGTSIGAVVMTGPGLTGPVGAGEAAGVCASAALAQANRTAMEASNPLLMSFPSFLFWAIATIGPSQAGL